MYKSERYEQLIAWLNHQRSVSVQEVAQKFYVSLPTARRDLQALEDMGIVKRTYGRAVLLDHNTREIPIYLRQQDRKAEKRQIARQAATLIRNGDVLFLDGSSTVQHMTEFLRAFDNLTIITNSIAAAARLGELRIRTYSTGGLLMETSMAFAGARAQDMVRSVNADILFFSSQGLSPAGDIVDYSEQETELRRTMLERARKSVFLCDSSKFGKTSLFTVCHIDRVDYMVAERFAPDMQSRYKTALIQAGAG